MISRAIRSLIGVPVPGTVWLTGGVSRAGWLCLLLGTFRAWIRDEQVCRRRPGGPCGRWVSGHWWWSGWGGLEAEYLRPPTLYASHTGYKTCSTFVGGRKGGCR